ncbi:MAG: POTRA domain-containing protein [Acidobacteriaceae bacterium]|nr:POTRA domain-containing protein [Acidobacteriaceae bacterium]
MRRLTLFAAIGMCGVLGRSLMAQQGSVDAPVAPEVSAQAKDSDRITNVLPPLQETVWTRRGERVTAIRFEGVQFAENDRFLAGLKQKSGVALDPEKVREDMRLLFRTGRYRDLSVSSTTSPGGLELIYSGTPRYYVGRVEIDGIDAERLASLEAFATKLDPGAGYTEAQIPAAVDGIVASLAENGYFEPRVDVRTTTDDVGHQVNASFAVNTGPQARVGTVAVTGSDPGITVAEFRKRGSLNCTWLNHLFNHNCTQKISRETVSTALSGVRNYYQKKDRLEGTISLQKQTYASNRKQLDFSFLADQGPIVKVDISGAKVSNSRKKLLIPIYEEGTVDIDLLNEGAFNLRDYMQQQGYFDVTDDVKRTGKGTRNETVQYVVDKGEKHKVLDVRIRGNKYFNTDTIQERLSVKKGDLYRRSGVYSARLVASDVSSIEALYRASGFTRVKVTSSVSDSNKGPDGKPLKVAEIKVLFTVVEGEQQKFGEVKVSGVDESRLETIRSMLSTEEGQPFSLITLSGDRDLVLNYYLAHGFDHARIEYVQTPEKDDSTVTDVTMAVTEGRQTFVNKILISGVVHTKPALVQKQITLREGEPLDQAALLQTQRNLYNLALFNEANTAVQNPTGREPQKNVLIQLTEGKRWDVTYGFGFEAQTGTPDFGPSQLGRRVTAAQNGQAGVSPRVSLDVSRINLFGTQKSLTLHTTYGLLETVATLSLNNPQLFGNPAFSAAVSGGYSNVQNITTFQASTLQGDFRVTQKYKKADTFIYDFQYRRTSVNQNSLEITPNLVSQFSLPVTVGGPGLTYFHDTRDPSPLDAQKGVYYSVQEFFSYSTFGAETNFSRTDLSHSSYYTFGKHKYTLARNTRVAFENFFGGSSGVSDLSQINQIANCGGDASDPTSLLNRNATCNPIPLPERLYAGGATSHRGFGINQAGPRDLTTGYPVGGSGAVVNNIELRLPPPTLPLVGQSVSFVLFHDMGNVFRNPGDMFTSIKHFKQPNKKTCSDLSIPADAPARTSDQSNSDYYGQFAGNCDFNYYSHAVGLGVRYKTPVGPIRLDFSYNLNPPVYPVFTDYTDALPYVGHGGHFNFFFSIGQAF